ncbi:hypothetical protein [Kibdelosporangium phytohabitans]|uniref:hypothetical protein n=1 Tax=Kibdelosporangium phytohabitans TaxID=860235 RepID=UPI0012FC6242|nr:hypothetical protein [Kibdelosporangium phytohabitans]MBE1462197.1 hypothetical protein [Kibdelosporangium phytohabitans]
MLGTPSLSTVELDAVVDDGAEVTLLGKPLRWQRGSGGVRVELPGLPDEQAALVPRISPVSAVSAGQS